MRRPIWSGFEAQICLQGDVLVQLENLAMYTRLALYTCNNFTPPKYVPLSWDLRVVFLLAKHHQSVVKATTATSTIPANVPAAAAAQQANQSAN